MSADTHWYRYGTVTLTPNSTIVAGKNTNWQTNNILRGDIFIVDNTDFYEVLKVEDEEHLIIDRAYSGDSVKVCDYAIIRNFTSTTNAELAHRVAKLIEIYDVYFDSELERTSGPSAYELAKLHGYVGTEDEWIASLKGERGLPFKIVKTFASEAELDGENASEGLNDGDLVIIAADANSEENGKVYTWTGSKFEFLVDLAAAPAELIEGPQGPQGPKGEDGESAFEIAQRLDPSLTSEEAWLASLQGTIGKSSYEVAKEYNAENNYVWPDENSVGDTREGKTEIDWIKSMSAYGQYLRYVTNFNNSVENDEDKEPILSESEFFHKLLHPTAVATIV